MKINLFKPGSLLYPFRWFLLIALFIIGIVTYANLNGWRLFAFNSQQQWNAKGPGYHK